MGYARCPWTFQPLAENATKSPYNNAPLPSGWGDSVTHCIALAGARATGKSLYIGVVIKQLELLAQRFKKTVRPAEPTTAERYREIYEAPLFEEMRVMNSTPSSLAADAYQKDPLIYDLGWWPTGGVERKHYLVIRDVAGEDLEKLPPDPSGLSFFEHAHLIIFLFDPLRVQTVRTYTQGLFAQPSELGGDPLAVWDNLRFVLKDSRPPLAVTISKCDTLQRLSELKDLDWAEVMGNSGSTLQRDSGWFYDPSDRILVDMEVESVLRKLNVGDLVNDQYQFYGLRPSDIGEYSFYGPNRDLQFFAVSSLGEPTQGGHLHRKGIAPFRVLDPIRWHLSQYGVYEEAPA